MRPLLTRRKALVGLSTSLLLPAIAESRPSNGMAAEQGKHFLHGVASGDPSAESLVIWTRVSQFATPVQVDWRIAEDLDFTRVVSRGTVTARASSDYTVKIIVSGLRPGTTYYYRFALQDEESEVGRTRTLPVGDIESLSLAVVSCSNYPFGYFNAYEAIALDESIEWVLHLGDYLYEYGPDGYGGKTGARLSREHHPARETVSLEDYRLRHAQYKADPKSRMMHAAHPLLAIWDDHETTNNPWLGGAQNHQPAREGDWAARRDAALQAYFEWMPVRDPLPGHARSDYWRHFRFGDLASLISLETRHSGRAEQIEYGTYEALLTDRDGARQFMLDVVGAEDRPMLSASMESFFSEALCESRENGRPWRLIANQIPMARTLHPRLSTEDITSVGNSLEEKSLARLHRIARMGELELPLYLDPWDGYPIAREEFYRLCQRCDVRDLLVLTGDSHSFWSNTLFDAAGAAMGLELGTTGVTSPGDFIEFGEEGAQLIDRRIAETNPEIVWTDGRHNGYLKLQVERDMARADYLAVSTILGPDYRVFPLRSIPILRQGDSLSYGDKLAS